MSSRITGSVLSVLALICVAGMPATAQSFRVQCPTSTITHPVAANNNSEPAYNGPTYTGASTAYTVGNSGPVNGAIKCQQISGGDGYSTMADGTQTFMFSFGPLSGLSDMAAGLPATQFPNVFNSITPYTLQPGDPATTDSPTYSTWPPTANLGTFNWNGAVGLIGDPEISVSTPSGVQARATATGDCARFLFQTRWNGAASLRIYSDTFIIGKPASSNNRSCATSEHSTNSLLHESGHVLEPPQQQ